jgi:transcription initiation factor TFIIIB Brf1 subunit/transcription initiation factor TFIIB
LLKGRSLEAKVVVSLLFACRLAGRNHVKTSDLVLYARTRKEEISKCYKELKKIPPFGSIDSRVMPINYVINSETKLKFAPEVFKAARVVAENFVSKGICEGKKP